MNTQINDEVLKGISALAQQQVDAEQRVAELEERLNQANEILTRIRDVQLPDAMISVGMESFSLKDGTSIMVSKFYSASIPRERQIEAFAWLRSNQFGEIIKREIKSRFGKGEDEAASALTKILAEKKIPFEDKESVHPQTLKAFVRERIEAGENLPMESFGVFIGNRAKVIPANK